MAMSEIEAYIRKSAAERGIDPDVAVAVARSEGGLTDPFRRGEGKAPDSQLKELGDTENSIGPFQLYISGNDAGLGDRALKAGIDPRKDWKAGVDYALNEAASKGWGQWYGAKNTGIDNYTGLTNAKPKGITLMSVPASGPPLGELNTAPANVTPPTPTIVPPQGAETLVAGGGTDLGGGVGAGKFPEAPGIGPGKTTIADILNSDVMKSVGKSMGQREAPAEAPMQSRLSMDDDPGRFQAAQSLMASILAGKKRRGLSMTSVPMIG